MSTLPLMAPLPVHSHWQARLMTASFATTAVVVFVAGLVVALLRAGFVAPTAFGWSNSILLDGGWRLYQGQIPHSDFHSPLGYLYLLLVSTAMHLWGPTPHALAQSAALVVVPLAAAAWFLASRRLSPVLAALTVAFITVHAASISFFGTSDGDGISFSGQYTRIAWAVFFLIPLQSLIDPVAPLERTRSLIEYVLVGAVLGILFGIKATFFAGGLACVTAGLLIRPAEGRWRAATVMTVSCGVVIVAGLAASGASLNAYLFDLAMTQRSNATSSGHLLAEQLGRTDAMQSCLLIAGLMMSWSTMRDERKIADLVPVSALRGLGLLALGFAISAYNGTEFASPIYGLCTLIICATALRSSGVTAIAVVALAGPLLIIGVPVCKAGWHGRPDPGASDSLDVPAYRGIDFVAGGHADDGPLISAFSRTSHAVFATAYLRYLREGVEHLHRHLPEGSVVVTMDVANPFPFALGWPSPKGDVLYWHLDRNVSAATAPSAETLFADVQAVMVPACAQMAGVPAGKMDLYRPYLTTHFTRIPLNTQWWSELWIRQNDHELVAFSFSAKPVSNALPLSALSRSLP